MKKAEIEKKIREILGRKENEKSKISLLETKPGTFVVEYDDENVDFSKLRFSKSDEGQAKFSFLITGGLNGSGDWVTYLNDLKSNFKELEDETGLKISIEKIQNDTADDVWTAECFLYDVDNVITDSKIKKFLNPKIWNEDKSLKPEIKDKIEEVVEKFKSWLKELKIDIDIKDVILIGSNASYNYNSKSDLDVHIIVPEGDDNVLKLYESYKSLFNKTYKIKFNKIPVEIYVQNTMENLKTKAIYSIYNGWLKESNLEEMQNVDISQEILPLLDEYKQVVEAKDINKIKDFIDKLYSLREDAFNIEGDFAKGNLIFKEFRTKGYLKKLKDLQVKLETKSLSLGDEEIPQNEYRKVVYTKLWDDTEENSQTKNVGKILEFGWNFYKDYLIKGLEDMFKEVKRITEYNKSAKEFANKGLGSANTQSYKNLFDLIDRFKELKTKIRDELMNIKSHDPWSYKPSFREYLLKIYDIIGGKNYMKDSKKNIVERGFDEYLKCLKNSEEGKFEYSERLIEVIHQIEELTKMPEQEIMGMFEEMKEQKDIVKDSAVSLSKSEIKSKLTAIMEKYLLSLGYEKSEIDEWLVVEISDYTNPLGDKAIKVEIRNEFVEYYDLPEKINQELDEVVKPFDAYFEPWDAMTWDAFIWDENLKVKDSKKVQDTVDEEQYERLVRNSAHGLEILDFYDISQQTGELFDKICSELALPEDEEWAIAPEVLKDDELMTKLYNALRTEIISLLNKDEFYFDTAKDERYGEHEATEKILELFNINKKVIYDAMKYVYQFPADMTQEDIEALKDYKLEYLGKVSEDGFQPGDHLVKGNLSDLKEYCEKWIGGYEMHPDYLYKESDIDLEDVLDEVKSYTIYSDKEEGPSMEEIKDTLDKLGIKIKNVKEQSKDSYLVIFDCSKDDMIKLTKELNLEDDIEDFELKDGE